MKNIAIKILKKLEKKGEITLEEISLLLPKIFNDHRDFYIFACLVAIGYIDNNKLLDTENPNPNKNKEQLLAREYYACSTQDKTAKYENHTWSIQGGKNTLKGQNFALSAKGSLFLSEFRTKRFDRIFTMAAGITIGIIVAIAGAFFRVLIETQSIVN